ncbi:MAG TPA: 1-phosphofructokinase family hexose kinase [Dongiaceae bacterium]|nr:1-phosphofructokinase family hexose kinase [Dongiaceae bacterium]
MILCLGTTPSVQRVMVFRKLTPDAVNRAVTVADGPAGKSVNAAKVLKTLGEQPLAAGFLGGVRGRYLLEMLAAKGVESDFVTVAAHTRLCVTVIDQQAGTQTELIEEGPPVEPADYEQLSAVLRRRIPTCRAVVMSGSLALGGPIDLYAQATRLAREAGVLSIVDALGAPLAEALKAGPSLVKPNRAELAATVGRELKDEAEVMSAMRELSRRGAQRVVVTAGKAAALAFDGQAFWRIVPPAVRVVNPIGCGDAFTAGLVWRLLRGEGLGEACRWAAAAGAANALTLMPGEVERAEVERLAGTVRVEPL